MASAGAAERYDRHVGARGRGVPPCEGPHGGEAPLQYLYAHAHESCTRKRATFRGVLRVNRGWAVMVKRIRRHLDAARVRSGEDPAEWKHDAHDNYLYWYW